MDEVFDAKYSDEVSLSRILDFFLMTDEKVEIILDFLDLHKKDIRTIFLHSDCYQKMFQSDFFMEIDGIRYENLFFDALSCIDVIEQHLFLSQIVSNRDEFPPMVVNRCMSRLKDIVSEYSYISHRYAGMDGKYGQMLDSMFKGGKNPIEVARCMPTSAFIKLCPHLNHSLYEGRILQLDFYTSMSPLNRQMLLKNLSSCSMHFVHLFTKQILTSDVDAAEKYELFRAVKIGKLFGLPKHYEEDGAIDTVKELIECESYPEFSIRSTLVGKDENRDVIFYMLFHTKLDVLFEMVELDREKLDKICKISDLLLDLKKTMDKKGRRS